MNDEMMVDERVEVVKFVEQIERYDDMVKLMMEVMKDKKFFVSEERNLFFVVFKNVVGVKCLFWRVVIVLEEK